MIVNRFISISADEEAKYAMYGAKEMNAIISSRNKWFVCSDCHCIRDVDGTVPKKDQLCPEQDGMTYATEGWLVADDSSVAVYHQGINTTQF